MAKLIVDDLGICSDCLLYIANGDAGSPEANLRCADGVRTLLDYHEAQGGAVVPSGDENEEGYFSWRYCDCCRAESAGNRYAAAIIM